MDKNKPENTNVTTTQNRCLAWFKKNKYEIVINFVVTILGVWAAFELAGWGEKRTLDKTAKQELCLVGLEARSNIADIEQIFEDYTDANSLTVSVIRANSLAATLTLKDTNILSILPVYKIHLLLIYINAIDTLNQTIQLHEKILQSNGFCKTPEEINARINVHITAAATLAITQVVKEEFKEYFIRYYDGAEANRLLERIEFLDKKVLEGKLEFIPKKD